MANYYPLIAKAVSGLERSTGQTRSALYDRARTALLAQLRGVEPRLTEPDITRERLALEEAIRKVEAEAVGRAPSANESGSLLEIIRRFDETHGSRHRPKRDQKSKRRREEEERLRLEKETKQREAQERLRLEQETKQREEEERLRHKQASNSTRHKNIGRKRGPARPALQALDNVLPIIDFERGPVENIRIKPGTEFPIDLPLPSSKNDHAERLAACRSLAETLTDELNQRQFELLSEYRDCVVRYLAVLPTDSDPDHNFLPADTEARIVRWLFASEADTLPKSICARLNVFLENHQGMRVFYPGLKRFYDDIRNGRIAEPLPLDAMTEFVAGINKHSPSVFDPSVRSAFEGISHPLPHSAAASSDNARSKDDSPRPGPPPDPLGEIDPQKSHDFTFASMANSLWRILSFGKQFGDTIEGWEKALNVLRGPFAIIADWLFRFYGGG